MTATQLLHGLLHLVLSQLSIPTNRIVDKDALMPRSQPIMTPTSSPSSKWRRQISCPDLSLTYRNFDVMKVSVEPAAVLSVALRTRDNGELAGVFREERRVNSSSVVTLATRQIILAPHKPDLIPAFRMMVYDSSSFIDRAISPALLCRLSTTQA